jgi:DNA polymerase-1
MAQRFFTIYPEIKSGQLRQKAAVENDGYAELTIDGRRLYYPATMRGFNQALNFPMQGTGGALCNRALLELEPQLDWQGGCQVRVQVHDELLVQAPYARASEVAEKLTAAMSRPAQIGASFAGIPAAADPGLSWGDCKAWNIFCNEHPSLLA